DEMMGEQAFENLKSQIQEQEEARDQLNKQHEELKQQRININETIEKNESQLQVCHQDILAIENHYQDIKAKQSKLDVLINHAIDHLNDVYQLTVERARTLYESNEPIESLRKKVKL
ncbi:TPA: hypothetical protein LUK14_005188, partial [Escherichia coli]|nr:hypothetical protein [Escherichia coli]